MLVTVSDPIANTSLSTYFESAVRIVLAEEVGEVDRTVQTEVDSANNSVAVGET